MTDSSSAHVCSLFQRDSIFLHDSVFIRIRADTVCLEHWQTRWRDRETVRIDTVRVETVRTDTVQVRYVPAFYKYCTAFAILVVLFLLVRLALYLFK